MQKWVKLNVTLILIITVFSISIFTSIIDNNKREESIIYNTFSINELNECSACCNEGCAGGIATGMVVKDGRNIFWKNRHMTGENEKPRFEHGSVYDYWMNTGGTWGMNEVGLALGNFAQSGTLDNWEYYSDASYGQTYGIQSYLLGHFDNVTDAALFAAQHMGGKSTLGIVGADPGVGAVVYSGTNSQGQQVCNITWINDTYMALANAYECDGEYDAAKWYDAQGRLDDSFNEHGYIDWADVIQKGARDVKGREQGTGAFTSCCVSKPPSLSSIIAVSGDPRWNGSANIAWTCLARQPLVGIYVPLGASYLQYTDERDIPDELTSGGGMEDYVDAKVNYATNGGGQGSSTYYAEKVREIQNYTFQIENYSFDLYDQYMNSLQCNMTQDTVENMLKNYVDTNVPLMIEAYVNETYIYGNNSPPIVTDIPDQTINESENFTPIYLDSYVSDIEDTDENMTWSVYGNTELIVNIDANRIANITAPSAYWNGTETIIFTVQDTNGLTDLDAGTFTVLSSNRPVIYMDEIPGNESMNISITTSSFTISISDPDGDDFDWSIETNPNIGTNYGNNHINGSKSCSISNLFYSTTYKWYVNATDGQSWTREVFIFTTEKDNTKPLLEFVPPTPEDFYQTTNDYARINISITDESDRSGFIDWNQSLIGYWNFEYINPPIIIDNSTRNRHGFFYGNELNDSLNMNGKYGNCLDFDGNDDYIDLAEYNVTSGLNETTIEFWLNPDEWIETNTIWDEYSSGNYWQNSIRGDYWYTRDTSTGSNGSRNNDLIMPDLTPGSWYHLAFVYSVSKNSKTIYLNGDEYITTSNDIDRLTTERQATRIGFACDGDNYDGKIDEVRIWNRALSHQEIKSSYNSKINRLSTNFSSLKIGCYSYYGYAIDIDGNIGITETRNFEVTNQSINNAPVLSSENPGNGSVDVSVDQAMVNVTIRDPEGDSFDWSIEGQFVNDVSGTDEGNGSKQASLMTPLPFDTVITWYVNATDGTDTSRAIFEFTTRAEYVPGSPTVFMATADGRFEIDITWVDDSKADATLVEWSSTSDPTWNIGDHTELYNGSNEMISHTGLFPDTQIFYKAWSWNETDNVWSNGVTDDAISESNTPLSYGSPSPVNGSTGVDLSLTWSIMMSDGDGDSFDWSIECSNGQLSSGTGESDGVKQVSLSGLAFSRMYMVWVNASDGFDTSRAWFVFTTRPANEPGVPSGFLASVSGMDEIDLSWTKGTDADRTYIEWNSVSGWSTGAGTVLYNDTGTGLSHTGLDAHTQYFYQAWSWNETDQVYSGSYVADDAMTLSNQVPVLSFENPANESTGVDINQGLVNVTIRDPEGDSFDWSIEGQFVNDVSGTDEGNGSKQASLMTPLPFDTVITWYVNVSDDKDTTNVVFEFNTKDEQQSDVEPPSNISNLTVKDAKDGKLILLWDNTTDNVALDYYCVYRDGILIYNTSLTTYMDTGLNNGQTYWYQISAVDAAGNEGELSLSKSGKPTKKTTSENGGGGYSPPVLKNIPPIADVSAGESYTGFVNEEIVFDGTASIDSDGIITDWTWIFEDGGEENGETVTHIFTEAGNYSVSLTITDDNGSTDICVTTAVIINRNNPPSTPIISGPSKGSINISYNYSFISIDPDNDSINYIIDWGDASTNNTSNIKNNISIILTHMWSNAGLYKINVYAKDNQNLTSSVNSFFVLIDITAYYMKDDIQGYLLDEDNNGIFDFFYNNVSNTKTTVELHEDGNYLIDNNDDGIKDYSFNVNDGLQPLGKIQEHKSNISQDIPWIFIIIGIILTVFLSFLFLLKIGFLIIEKDE